MPIPAELQSLLSELKISPPTKEHAAVETVEALEVTCRQLSTRHAEHGLD